MRRYIPLAMILLGLLFFWQASLEFDLASALAGSPSIEYLGEGGSYTIDTGRQFIVKRRQPFRFVNEPGPTYEAAPGERVWASSSGTPPAKYDTWVSYGRLPEGCKVSFVAIDDDIDDRINEFFIDGEMIFEMSQGMVSSGQFTTPEEGELTLHIVDSIGIWLDKCDPVEIPTVTPIIDITPSTTPEPSSTPAVPGPTSTKIASTPTPTKTVPTVTPTATKKPRLPACLRINFEISGDEALEGLYEVREVGGRLLYTWYAQDGWQDSGWVYNIDISFEDVYIEVFFVPEDGPPIKMQIVNPSPGTQYAWLSRGMCHALEVAWPDETPTPTPDAFDGFNDTFDHEELERQDYIWPDLQPEPTGTPASSLRG
jgi:hypothetical protein